MRDRDFSLSFLKAHYMSQPSSAQSPSIQQVPAHLVYEELDGRPLYYRGYERVLAGETNAEAIMGSSGLQSVIISFFLETLFRIVDGRTHRVLSNEVGQHISKGNNLAGDIAVYDRQVLTPDKIDEHYVNVPADLIVEVDLKADVSDLGETGYLTHKTQKLLDFGVKQVLWVLSQPQKVLIAAPDSDWLLVDWNKEVELWGGERVTLGNYLREEGIL